MAIPTAPTATTIVTEALTRKLNGGTPSAAEITRATNYGLEKVKRDVMLLCKKWKPLMQTSYDITKDALSKYPLPSDCEAMISVGIIYGDHTGTLTAKDAVAKTVTLAADEDVDQGTAESALLLITSGTGKDQAKQIDDYSTSTKVATFDEYFATTPDIGDGYMVCTVHRDLESKPVRHTRVSDRLAEGEPFGYILFDDATYGYVELIYTPDDVYGIEFIYFADLRRVDITGSLYTTLLRRWAAVFEQGVYAWSLGEDDDRFEREDAKYWKMLKELRARDGYLQDESDLQRRVVE